MKCVICKQNIDILYHNGKAIRVDVAQYATTQ
jgi:hypothetical protein